ncbi:hypothetical protein A0H81_00235 [Grifola frondosa]|uniref:HAT C-terminal dimerisation domain-containing protein n=1 Tax=Grifola frondosa TaxID=5627 RepID=A0A1C7MPI9_GRIFR|nr:hypothetical protein A0H81_00235 [Grifola frondosa]
MAGSVLSEQAFSQGGITISNHRNRLKGDIVEALQALKCAICQDLLFRSPAPSSSFKQDIKEISKTLDGLEGTAEEAAGAWDLVLDDNDDDLPRLGPSQAGAKPAAGLAAWLHTSPGQEPYKAGPKPWLSGQAGPAQH